MTAAALLAGASGFGLGLVATPLLLLLGYSLPFVVTVNLLISLVTRLSVAYRFRRGVEPARVAILVVACAPGLYLGAQTLAWLDHRLIRVVAGVVVALAAILLFVTRGRRAREPKRAAVAVAGFAGGFLGTTTSLVGIPPVLLLAHAKVAAVAFIADLAFYFICSSTIGLGMLATSGDLSGDAFVALLVWLPAVLLGNVAGTSLALRLPEARFRGLTLLVAFVAGATTAVTA